MPRIKQSEFAQDRKKVSSLFTRTREQSEALVKPLELEDFSSQPEAFVSPPKWHLAHSSWFFEEFILSKTDGYSWYNEHFRFLFNSYYNNVGERVLRNQRGDLTRPTIQEVLAYRFYVTNKIQERIDNDLLSDTGWETLELGINHEQQHQELLITDIKYILGIQTGGPPYKEITEHDSQGTSDWLAFEGGVVEIGYSGSGFHFDNEQSKHKVYLNAFEIASELVSNGEYLQFIEDGGYQDFRYWHDEGWSWVNDNNITSPLYWNKSDDAWKHYTLGGVKPIDKKGPLSHVSYYEAFAFASWKGLRLPTEAEWEHASDQFKWGRRWEWTASSYEPYPGFKMAKGAIGEYNGKFMVNQRVLRGGSFATPEGHSRRTYRNFFHPHYQWQYTGIRLAR